MDSEKLKKITEGRGSIELRREDVPDLLFGLKLAEGLTEELARLGELRLQTEKDLVELSEAKMWSSVVDFSQRLDEIVKDIRRLEGYLRKGWS